MYKKFFFLLPLLLCFAQINAQLVCGGKMLNAKESKIEEVCFLRTPNPIGNTTKYTILLSGIEIYEVEFTYYKEGDSISIKFYDKQNTTLKRESVRLKSEDSHFLICDFKPNIKRIMNSEGYRMLFGIDNPNQQFITLYQFQAIGGTQIQFKLQDVPDSILSEHKTAVNDYEVITDIRQKHAESIAQLKKDMLRYKDSLINSITEKETAKLMREATVLADKDLLAVFTKKMDFIFINYFKNIHSFNEEAFDINFAFSCNGSGKIKIDPNKSINFKTGSQNNWFRDSFLLRVKPIIEDGTYNTLTESYTNPKLNTKLNNWFEDNFASYPDLGASDRDSFAVLLKNCNDELSPYLTRSINLSTVYTYSFKYISSIKSPVWKYVKQKDGHDKFIDKSDKEEKVQITENLMQLFVDQYGSLGNGKYKLKVSLLTLNNGMFTGNQLRLTEKK